MDDPYMSFERLPKGSQEHLLSTLGSPDDERQLLRLRYVMEYSRREIAAQMGISHKSVGRAVYRAKEHAVEIARRLYPLADEKSRMLIDVLGWREIPWPVETNRRKVNRGELPVEGSSG